MDIKEPESIKKEYGLDSGTDLKRRNTPRIAFLPVVYLKKEFGSNCTMEAILPEVTELLIGTHSNIHKTHAMQVLRSWTNPLPH